MAENAVIGVIVGIVLTGSTIIALVKLATFNRNRRIKLPVCSNCQKKYVRPVAVSMVDPASKEGHTNEYCPNCGHELSSYPTDLKGKDFTRFSGRESVQ